MNAVDTRDVKSMAMRRVGKYFALGQIAFRQAFSHRGRWLGVAIFYAVILVILVQLWQAVLGSSSDGDSKAGDMLWYVAVTEWLYLSAPRIFDDIEHDVRSGDIAYHVTRPVSYVMMKIAEGTGDMCLRALVLGGVGVVIGYMLVGSWPSHPEGLLWLIPLGVLAMLLGVLLNVMIGLSAVWIQDITPVYWLVQKLIFVFGGLMLPLSVYPEWMQTLARFTPFYVMLYGTGRLMLEPTSAVLWDTCMLFAIWYGVAIAALWFIHTRAMRVLNVNGG